MLVTAQSWWGGGEGDRKNKLYIDKNSLLEDIVEDGGQQEILPREAVNIHKNILNCYSVNKGPKPKMSTFFINVYEKCKFINSLPSAPFWPELFE